MGPDRSTGFHSLLIDPKHLHSGDRRNPPDSNLNRKLRGTALQDTFAAPIYTASMFGKTAGQSPMSENISLTDDSQPDTPPSVSSCPPPFQYEELKQQVQFLQTELHRYRQREAQDRITQHTLDEIVGPASDADHLLIGPGTGPVLASKGAGVRLGGSTSRPFACSADSWSVGLACSTSSSNRRDAPKAPLWPIQPSVFGTAGSKPFPAASPAVYPLSMPFPHSPSPPSSAIPSTRPGPTSSSSFVVSDAELVANPAIGAVEYPPWPAPGPVQAYGVPHPSINPIDLAPSAILPIGAFSQSTAHIVNPPRSSYVSTGTLPAVSAGLSVPAGSVGFDMGYSPGWTSRPGQGSCNIGNPCPNPEPLNYRRLLEKDACCNWDYVVEKIVCNNDQQASIFLQQKLKIGSTGQKHEIVDAILKQCYPLMINRFGNFLVQRCFEHGTAQQIVSIAQTIRGNTISLSMDPFGCHVVQKALDCVPEEYKAYFVHELLRRIPDTVVHRYACHVWQKLFERHWDDSPPQIMKFVNEALAGMWHEVALGETGSLVVQNIFENCVEEDKRPCIEEVLASVDVISRGQFGNWCIQHICENGQPDDKARAIDHVVCYATDYSIDQYASKVIEKCLKVGGSDFFDRYLARVCEARPDRPRMPLIDIAGDQFGNYLIQYILANASSHHRDLVATHVRKHMVSLRGSKYGSRVAMLCSNPSTVTRPGPPTGSYTGRYNGRGYRNHHYG